MKDLEFTADTLDQMLLESNGTQVLGIVTERILQLSTADLSHIAGAWAHKEEDSASSNVKPVDRPLA